MEERERSCDGTIHTKFRDAGRVIASLTQHFVSVLSDIRRTARPYLVLTFNGNWTRNGQDGVIVKRNDDVIGQYLPVVRNVLRGSNNIEHDPARGKNVSPFCSVLGRKRLVEHGGLLTEFPAGTPPTGQNFPFRNRVISGLAHGVLVVEAAERSGSLITARMASEQGRDVFAVPGNVTSGNSYGPNLLIKDGARVVLGWSDVVEELPAPWRDEIFDAEREKIRPIQATLATAADVSDDERTVLRHLPADAPRAVDSLTALTRLDAGRLSDALLTLELKGLVAALPGGLYCRRL
mgnify:CR=1 FL=1